MIDNTTKKTININDDNASAISKDKSSKPVNLIKDLSSINKDNDIPWFKKKGSIIGISATLGAGALATIIAVPIALTSSEQIRKVGEIRKVVNFYDFTKKTAKLVVTGSELPKDKTLYEVSRITSSRAIILVDPNLIDLVSINKEEINLNFTDSEVSPTSVYQVKLNNGSPSGSVVQSSESVPKRKIDITTQPQNHTIPVSSTETSVSLTVVANIIDHTGQPIAGIEPTYQWKMANDNSLIESDWYTIPNATQSIYTYDVSGLVANEKKYFKCVISDKYADSSTTEAAFVTKVNNATIAITNQSSSIDVPVTQNSATLSVTASVVNATNNPTLTYQWQQSDSATGTFTDISGANSSTYTYDVSSVQTGSKKYFKCIVSSAGIASVESRVIYVGKNAAPTLSFTKEIGDIIVPLGTNNVTLSVDVAVDLPIAGQNLTYTWYESTSNTSNATWNVIPNRSGNSISFGIVNLGKTNKHFFKCEVTYNSGNKITSSIGSIVKSDPIVTFTKQIGENIISSTATDTNVTLSVEVNVAYPIANASLKYKWYQLSSASDQTGTVIQGATSKTYTYNANQNNIQSGQTKYFKCEAIFGEAYKAHSIGSITKRGPSITISKDLNSITGFTPSSANPILSIGASIINDGSNSRPLSYQWQSSSSENGQFADISGATNSSYTIEIPDKTNWADKWFKCKVTSNTDTISAVYSKTTCVKMQLTNAQARAELINWFNVDANATKVLKQFFDTRTDTDVQKREGGSEFFRYLYDHEFNSEEKLWFPQTEFYSATSKTIRVGDATPFKSYTIVLKTISDGQYRTKKQGSTAAGSWTNLVTGAYIQFDLLFSFTGNAELVRENGTSKYTVNFSPLFRSIGGRNITSLAFDYTGSNGNLKKGAYTVKVYAHDGNANTPLFTDSSLQSVNLAGMSSDVYKDIPTYNGVTGRK